MAEYTFSDIKFGKIDAQHELQTFGNDLYMTAFLQYDRYKINEFLRGDAYYIYGKKGTGKTALLQYLKCRQTENPENLVAFVRFKSQFDVEDRKSLAHAADKMETVIEELPVEQKSDGAVSYVNAWCAYITNLILEKSAEGEYSVFKDTAEYRLMRELVGCIFSQKKEFVMPKLRHGMVKVGFSSLKGIGAEISADLDFNQETGEINFSKTVKKILNLYEHLEPDETPVYVFFDELELTLNSKKLFVRDIALIRDLILAINKMNQITHDRCYKIITIASIRSDVLEHTKSFGYEINKCIEDYGVKIDWYHQGGNYLDSPLLKLIENKIHAWEKSVQKPESSDVWKTYFPESINGVEIRRYILSLTWQRPRDIIRMMTLLQNNNIGGGIAVSQEAFDISMREYSRKTWDEIAEELRLAFSGEGETAAIKQFFTGISIPFTLASLQSRAEEKGKVYPEITVFFQKYKINEFLERMYEWGVIGNRGRQMVFSFMGDSTLDLTGDMTIHKPLRNFFSVKDTEAEKKRNVLPINCNERNTAMRRRRFTTSTNRKSVSTP